MVNAFLGRRNLMIDLIKEIPGFVSNTPEGAFYLFPDVSGYFGTTNGQVSIDNSVDLCDYLLNDAHVAVVPGSAFGSPECIRISYAASDDQIREAISRIKNALIKLKKT